MRASHTRSSHSSSGSKTQPLQPPPRRFLQTRKSQLLALVLSPFVVTLLVLWGILGFLLRLQAFSVAAVSTVATWVLYLCLPEIPTSLIDWPIVFTVGYAALSFLPSTPKATTLFLAIALAVYAIVRGTLYDTEPETTTRSLVIALETLGVVLPLWVAVCRLNLWVPADEKTLDEVEKKIYKKYVVTDHTVNVVAGLGTVHVPYCGDSSRLPPRNLVLVHGYMAGNAFWAANLQTLAKSFNVYVVEWKGIGRSIRPKFRPKTEQEMDDFFVESLEEWRRVMQLDRFIICGHSMGAMYVTYYTEKYTQHIEQLLLVSPAGVRSPDKPETEPFWVIKLGAKYSITPMSIIRYLGPFGPRGVQWGLRRRIQWVPETNIIRSGDMDFSDIALYCYHNWALKASGDIAVHTHLHLSGGGASVAHHRPLNEILTPGKLQVPLTILYGGGGDWMPSEHGEAVVRRLEKTQYAAFRLVPSAGHQVFMDNPVGFNQIIIDAVHDHERAAANGRSANYDPHH